MNQLFVPARKNRSDRRACITVTMRAGYACCRCALFETIDSLVKEDVKGSCQMDVTKNADRFMGYADVYHMARPRCPQYVVDCLVNYLGYFPRMVVDLGCGTGLSARLWGNAAAQVVGVEPSLDMLAYAQEHSGAKQNIRFIHAFAHETGLEDACADIVTCSQSFHWMEPEQTLQEVNRILKPGGIFATYDCDWPPVCGRRAEEAYNDLRRRIAELASATKDYESSFLRWEKNEHLDRIRESGYFGYVREIVFSNREECDANRFINLALSQGGLQTMLRLEPEIVKLCVSRFEKKVHDIFEDEIFRMDFSYRMRIGIKDEQNPDEA